MSNFLRSIKALAGDHEAAVSQARDALGYCLTQHAQHGNRNALAGVSEFCAGLVGKPGKGARAVCAGWDAIRRDVAGLKPGKTDPANMSDIAERLADAFYVSAAAVLTAKPEKKKADPKAQAAKALATLLGLTRAQFLACMRTADAQSLVQRFTAEAAADASIVAAALVVKRAKGAQPIVDAQPATVAPIVDAQPA